MYQPGSSRMFSNSVSKNSPGMMTPPRPNAHSYNAYNQHYQQYVEPNRSYSIPPGIWNSRNVSIESNRSSNVGPRQIVGCTSINFPNTDPIVNPNVTPVSTRAANPSNKPGFSVDQSSSATVSSCNGRNNVQQPLWGQQSIRECSVKKNQQHAQNTLPVTNGDTKNTENDTKKNNITASFDFKLYGSTEKERIFMLTGTIDRIIKWSKIFRNQFCYFEVIAPVVSIQEGSIITQKVMLLRDKKGPILQVIYYETTHIDIKDFFIGQMLTCTGRMTGANIFNALCIRSTSPEEADSLERLTSISEQAVEYHLSS